MNAPHSTPASRASQRPAPQQDEAPVTRRTQWVRGSVASWGLGVTLGVILGVGVLIATPRLMGKPAEATPASTAPANTNENGPADAGKSEGSESGSMAGGEGTSSEGASGEAASGEATSGDMAAGEGASSAAGEAAAGTSDSAAGDTEAVGDAQAGQTVFAGNCAGCHGANGQGQIGPSLVTADGPKSWTLAQFTTTLREGKTPERELSATMPRFGEAQISDTQIADLQAYIKTLN
ncbi:c-type cytochrome [Deinococcus kurensis]|uniref:c-type cytochrome n=1 Tax=Deinococcus kurensis TaxID=2662757 RepID=UPI0013915046|nr:cytochrome c [Deinococcus kurensis]